MQGVGVVIHLYRDLNPDMLHRVMRGVVMQGGDVVVQGVVGCVQIVGVVMSNLPHPHLTFDLQGKPTEAGASLSIRNYGEVDTADIVPGTEVSMHEVALRQNKGT